MFNIKWDKDEIHRNCYNCNNKFTFLVRKHHCRKCGKIFCYNCINDYYIFNQCNIVCNDCKINLDNSILVNKNDLKILQNKLTRYKNSAKLTNFSTIHTQTHVPTCKSTETQIDIPIRTIGTQTEEINNCTSKSLDILECIQNVSKKNPISNKYLEEIEILKYKTNQNKRYHESLLKKEQELKKKEAELLKIEKQINKHTEINEAQVDKANIDKAPVDKVNIDKAQVDKAQVDKAQVDKAQVDKANIDKAQVDKAQVDKAQVDINKPINMSTRELVLKRKMDKKKAEEDKYINELKNIHNEYKNDIKKL